MKKRNNIIILIIFLIFLCIFAAKSFIASNKGMIFESKKNIFVMPDETVDGNVYSFKGDIYINGTVNGNVKSIKGNIYINGNVSGDVTSVLGNVNKGENGEIHGKVVENKGMLLKVFNNIGEFGYGLKSFKLGNFIFVIILCLIANEISPYVIDGLCSELRESFLRNLAVGYMAIFGICIISILLLISIIGILILPIVAIVFILQFIIGFTSCMMYVGKWISKIINLNFSNTWELVIGVLVYELIMIIPYWGNYIFIFLILPLCIGIGQHSRFGIYRPRRRNLV